MKRASTKRSLLEGQHQSLGFAVKEDQTVLIEWLNSAVGSKSYLRVSRLIHNIKSATELWDAAVRNAFSDLVQWHARIPGETGSSPPKKRRRRREIDRLLEPIEIALKGYVFHPRLTFQSTNGARWWFDLVGDPVVGDYKLTRTDGRRVFEADAAFGVLRLSSYRLLDRVRQCLTCKKWLYARPSHKKFCDSACLAKYFASTPLQKEKRAEYMRGYRIDQKQRWERERALVLRRNRK